MADATDYFLQKVPLEFVKNQFDEERYLKILSVQKYINHYVSYTNAQYIGLKYRPVDLEYETMHMFTVIKERIDNHNKGLNNGN